MANTETTACRCTIKSETRVGTTVLRAVGAPDPRCFICGGAGAFGRSPESRAWAYARTLILERVQGDKDLAEIALGHFVRAFDGERRGDLRAASAGRPPRTRL